MSIAEKLTAIAENEQKVFDAGKKAEWDAFWDAAQKNGSNHNFAYAFAGTMWKDETFKPKYNIVATGAAYNMFYFCEIVDLTDALNRCGVILDVSQATTVSSMFAYCSKLKRVPELDVRGVTAATGFDGMFNQCTTLQTVEKMILPSDRKISFTNAFTGCHSLTDLTIEGVINASVMALGNCPLSKASMISVMNAISATESITLVLKKSAVEAAFGSTDSDEWLALIATKPNCTISMA